MADTTLGTVLRQIHSLFREGATAGIGDALLLERFLNEGDASAFESLVARHGPMVLTVCRGILKDPHDAEDAFQATFLVLAEKARVIRGQHSLAGWLYRVTQNVALKANANAERRRKHERAAGSLRLEAEHKDDLQAALLAALHEEIARLPEKCRLAIVHCYFQGKTHAQAAAELRWGEATVRRKLADARETLRSRLTQRGLALAIGLLDTSVAKNASAAVPNAWLHSAVRAVAEMAKGRGTSSGVAAALAEATLTGLITTRLTTVAAATLALGMVAAMTWGLINTLDRDEPKPATAQPPVGSTLAVSKSTAYESLAPAAPSALYAGRVLDPQGRPFAGATLHAAISFRGEKFLPPFTAKTNAAGRFQVGLPARPKTEGPVYSEPQYLVVAQAPGYGLGVATFGAAGKPEVLQLTEDLPLTGRIIDLQGRPLAGVMIRPEWIWSPKDNDLTARLRGCAEPGTNRLSQITAVTGWIMGLIPPAITGADGRFRIEGIGRERILTALVEGPTIETAEITIMTRRAETVRREPKPIGPGSIPKGGLQLDVPQILGAASDFVAAPTRPITGRVCDRITGRPLAGAEIETQHISFMPQLKAVTDHDGRYRLVGVPIGREVTISAIAPDGEPYFQGHRSVTIQPGEPAVDVSFGLKRGIWIRGRAIDRSTGQPLPGLVSYFPFEDNPHASKDDASENLTFDRMRSGSTNRDGEYRILGLPGHGLVTLTAAPHWDYALGLRFGGIRSPQRNGFLNTSPMIEINSYHNLVEIGLPKHVKGFTQNLAADPGRSVTVRMIDPEGKPLTGVAVYEKVSMRDFPRMQPSKSSEYEVRALAPGEKRTMTFWHNRRRLIAQATVCDDQSGPITTKLQPWGVLTGRLVNTHVESGGCVRVDGMDHLDFEGDVVARATGGAARFPVGDDGRFRVEGLVPGTKYDLQVFENPSTRSVSVEGLSVASGETRDLGDLDSKDALR